MTSSSPNFPLRGLTDTDRYLLQRAAAEGKVSQNALVVDALREKLDQLLPGVREAYDRRPEILDHAIRRSGVDPDSPQYQKARRDARALLARADGLRKDRTA